MSTAPDNLLALRDYLALRTGLSPVSLGIVGNIAHRSGYHLGRDRIYASGGFGDNDYSVKTTRDRNGLTDFASAMDIGNFPRLRSFSKWLVAEAQKSADGTRDMREIIYSPDGEIVLRWDRERGFSSAPRPGEADSSHLTHTHVSWYRDSRGRDQRPIFRRFFEGESPDMRVYTITPEAASGTITVSEPDHWYLDMVADKLFRITPPLIRDAYGPVHLTETIDHRGDQNDAARRVGYTFRRTSGQVGFVLATDCEFVADADADCGEVARSAVADFRQRTIAGIPAE